MRSTAILAMIVLGAFTVPARADVPVEVRAHEEAFARTCQAGDVPGVLALYADDARVIWPGQGEEAKDKAGLERLVTRFCKETKGLKIAIQSLEAKSIGAEHLSVIGRWQITSTGADGKPVVAEMRATEILERQGGRLKYVLDHGSIGVPPTP